MRRSSSFRVPFLLSVLDLGTRSFCSRGEFVMPRCNTFQFWQYMKLRLHQFHSGLFFHFVFLRFVVCVCAFHPCHVIMCIALHLSCHLHPVPLVSSRGILESFFRV